MTVGQGHSSSRQSNVSQFGPGVQDLADNAPGQSAFWSVLQESAKEALKNALGDVILGVLTGQKMLENPEDVSRFTERLKTVFGVSGAKTLQFVIAKELYRRLGLPFDPEGSFDYAVCLESAKHWFASKK